MSGIHDYEGFIPARHSGFARHPGNYRRRMSTSRARSSRSLPSPA